VLGFVGSERKRRSGGRWGPREPTAWSQKGGREGVQREEEGEGGVKKKKGEKARSSYDVVDDGRKNSRVQIFSGFGEGRRKTCEKKVGTGEGQQLSQAFQRGAGQLQGSLFRAARVDLNKGGLVERKGHRRCQSQMKKRGRKKGLPDVSVTV